MARMTIEVPDQLNALLEELAKTDGLAKVDVIRRAIALYNYAHQQGVSTGKVKLSLTDKADKVLKDIVF